MCDLKGRHSRGHESSPPGITVGAAAWSSETICSPLLLYETQTSNSFLTGWGSGKECALRQTNLAACPCPSEDGQKKSTGIWFAIPAVRYTEASIPLRGTRYCGERDLGVVVVKLDYFTFVIASTILELICFYIYLGGKDCCFHFVLLGTKCPA